MTQLNMSNRFLRIILLFFLPLLLPAQDLLHPYQPGIDVIHYNFALDLPDTGRIIQGDATVVFRRTPGVNLLTLDLLDLTVSRVTLDGKEARFSRDNATIRIPLPPLHSPAMLDTFLVGVTYRGRVSDGLIVREDSSGRWTAFGDNWPNRARHWLPTVDHPSDKATVTWDVTAPANRTVVGNGSLTMRIPLSFSPSSRVRSIWTCHRPLPTYVMVIAAAPLVYRDLGLSALGESEFAGGVQQSLYTFPDQSAETTAFDSAVSIVNYFSRTIGPFPYEKLAHCQSLTIFGGMENASAIFYYDMGFRNNRISDDLIAHETAHQWFGDAVTPRTWQNLWLSEGFATYFAELWREHSQGDSLFLSSMRTMRNRLIRSRLTSERPVLDTAETNILSLLNSNSYQKGAWILHMLRSLLGDDDFFRGIRLYYSSFKHRTAVSSDLQQEMQGASGKQLGWFFDQWLRRPGYVEANLDWKFDNKTRKVELLIEQGSAFPPFRFQLTVGLKQSHGDTVLRTIDVPPQTISTISIPWGFPDPPVTVLPDPDVNVLGIVNVKHH